jgi:hypothetical protein
MLIYLVGDLGLRTVLLNPNTPRVIRIEDHGFVLSFPGEKSLEVCWRNDVMAE